jgi:SAM-dependent methyltransferase
MLRAEGWEAVDDADDTAAGAGSDVNDADDGDVVVQEGLVRYYAALTTGQKTGFYCDQRDARAVFAACAAAKKGSGGAVSVLDLCCYTGGFALAAAVAGASAHGVDSSEASVQLARRNASLNGVEGRCVPFSLIRECCFDPCIVDEEVVSSRHDADENVVKNGVVYEANTLDEIAPVAKKAPAFDWQTKKPAGIPGILKP